MTTIAVSVAAVGLFLFGAALCWLAWQVASARPHAAVEDESADPAAVEAASSEAERFSRVHDICAVAYYGKRFLDVCDDCLDNLGFIEESQKRQAA